ncbi:bis(5'-nucleosyl)-tetraphosphatase (symmetrical) YqeK [Oceanobacillus jeddahense]|uniref:bis(5'-nucleosyl)-tetraphosphatase (symmetrical) YqeK n=1 Tax=Oceanobacillus jeddahense TaxID=1462527 RepID=UPI0005962778|nr:bis(5'-nucleosyl)-tetraphosphatase (symmetrical) YqeK [Oceanobacillus jeddahense]
MDIETLKLDLEERLTKGRYEHTLRVTDTAIKLAETFRESEENAKIAALFHDYCKYDSLEEMKQTIAVNNKLPDLLLSFHHELWHGPVASLRIEEKYGITNQEIKDAIFFHTTGRSNMTKLDKIIFLADYIEPGRDFPGLDEVRDVAKIDLTKACYLAARNTVCYLMEKNRTVYPDSFHAYNDLNQHVFGGMKDE